ncbi:MAG: penicillin-binding transpeptidase domain-containing protein, partial [Actinomycetota bacterium]
PAGDVSLVNATGTPVKSLQRYPGKLSEPVKTSLDVAVQQAVEAVLATVPQPAAIVVLDSATGEVRASATRPVSEFNRAIGGRYPPGSTFKVVTAAAALGNGMKVTDKIDCPPEIEINGRKFRNFEGLGLGMITFADAFVNSCNTAFASIASKLPEKVLIDAAGWFGFERDYSVGLRTPKAAFPEPKDATERAAAAIGQARVQASPLHMASVAAAVASGSWKPPRLVLTPTPEQLAAVPQGPDPSVIKTLQDLMRQVVVKGTGVRANLPGAPVSGKTGTAEFGKDVPPKTHAWFIGFRGPYAFAVLVEGGGVGGEVAAPLAGALLAALPQS